MNCSNFEFLTPTVLLERYPDVKYLGWTEAHISKFLSSYLLLGLPKNKNRSALIDEASFIALINFTNKLLDAHTIRLDKIDYCAYDHLTPAELIEEYPEQTALLGWTATKIGIFLSCKLLFGIKKPTGQSNEITRRSFNLLVDHTVQTCDRRSLIIRKLNSESL